jgi:hypothetical protein
MLTTVAVVAVLPFCRALLAGLVTKVSWVVIMVSNPSCYNVCQKHLRHVIWLEGPWHSRQQCRKYRPRHSSRQQKLRTQMPRQLAPIHLKCSCTKHYRLLLLLLLLASPPSFVYR